MDTTFVLTADNYYSPDSPYYHYSQLKTYIKSPELYKLRHIDRNPEYQFEATTKTKIGSMVDELLSTGKTNFYRKVDVIKKEDPDLYDLQKSWPKELTLNESDYDEAMKIYNAFLRQPLMQDLLAKGEIQPIRSGMIEGLPFCMKADFIYDVIIFDEKASNSIALANAYAYRRHAENQMWHIQAWIYTQLTGLARFCHISSCVVDGVAVIKAFEMPPDLIEKGGVLARQAIAGIKAGKFTQDPVTMATIEMLPAFNRTTIVLTPDGINEEDDF